MTTSTLGLMTVEHFDGMTGRSVLFSQISLTAFAEVLFTILEANLEKESPDFNVLFEASPLQTSLVS